jgi:hypothetical protein
LFRNNYSIMQICPSASPVFPQSLSAPFVPRTGARRGTVRRPAVIWDGWSKASVSLNGDKTAYLCEFLRIRRHHFPFRCRNLSRRRTRLQSTFATGKSLSRERRTRFDFVRRRWLRRFFRRRSFRLLVTLNRFAVALCVFILGMMPSPDIESQGVLINSGKQQPCRMLRQAPFPARLHRRFPRLRGSELRRNLEGPRRQVRALIAYPLVLG